MQYTINGIDIKTEICAEGKIIISIDGDIKEFTASEITVLDINTKAETVKKTVYTEGKKEEKDVTVNIPYMIITTSGDPVELYSKNVDMTVIYHMVNIELVSRGVKFTRKVKGNVRA
jgi:hypothetical protein